MRIIERETEKGVEKYEYTPYNKIKTYQDREGAKTSFYYDNSWRLIKKVTGENNKKGIIEDKGETYTYDDMDRLKSKTDETGKTIKYKRNTNGDITEETLNGKTVYRYEYDKNFNIIKKYIYIEEKTYIEKNSYNACGEMIKKIPAGNYDKNR